MLIWWTIESWSVYRISDYLSHTNVQLGATYTVGRASTELYTEGCNSAAKYMNAEPDEVGIYESESCHVCNRSDRSSQLLDRPRRNSSATSRFLWNSSPEMNWSSVNSTTKPIPRHGSQLPNEKDWHWNGGMFLQTRIRSFTRRIWEN